MASDFLADDRVRSEMSFAQLLVRMWPYMRRYRGRMALVFGAVLGYTACGRVLPLLFGHAIDEGLKKSALSVVYTVAVIYLIVEVLRALFEFMQVSLSARFGNRVLFDLRETVIRHVQKLPASYFDKNPVGRTVTRVTNDVVSLGELFNEGFTAIFVNVIEIVAILTALCWVSVPLALGTVVIAPVLVYMTRGISLRIRANSRDSKRKLAAINAFTAESLNGIRVLQLYNRQKARLESFLALSREYRELQYAIARLFAKLWPVLNFFNLFSVAAALLLGAMFYQRLGLTIGELSAFVILLQSFFNPIRIILERYNQFQNSLASADRIFTLLAEPTEDSRGRPLPEGRLKGRIEFKNVSFRYSSDSDWVLKDINLTIEPGQSVAFVGRTGSGKTTLISLLQKLYPLEDGDILIDGHSLRELEPQSLRRRMGVVQQDNFIFRGTVRSNITLSREDMSESRVLTAAEAANVTEFTRRLPGGLDSVVEERGANLSVGEKQLIAFARVLAFDPDVLILDEATSNIDSKNEDLIQKATRRATSDRTSLIIAHRLSTILHCDLIVVLDQGRIVERGSHRDLLRIGGKYHDLYTHQVPASAPATL